MNKWFAIIIGLAMLTAAPLSVMAQTSEPAPEPEDPFQYSDPYVWDYNYTEPYWYYWPEPSGFNYSDGFANGTYVDFMLNEATGTVTEYTTTIVDYNWYYPMVYSDGDRIDEAGGSGYAYEWGPEPTVYTVNFFDAITIDGFIPNGHPMALGQSLVYMGENVMVTLTDYDYSSIYYQFGDANSTIVFTVPEGIEISDSPRYYDIYGIETVNITGLDDSYYGVDSSGSASAPGYWGYYEWDEAYLTLGNISCSIWVDRGSVEIVGRQIIIHTHSGATVSTSSWLDYGWSYDYAYLEGWYGDVTTDDDRGALAGAMDQGLVAAVGYLYANEAGMQYNDVKTMNDPTFQLEFKNIEQNRFQVQVSSDIEAGRIVTLNVNKEALNAENMDDVSVLFDDEAVRGCGSIEELVDLQGGTEAGYYMVSGTSQNTIFVYVPHFSTHTITVSLAGSQIVSILLPAAIAAAFVAAAVGLVFLRGKRQKDNL